jgi:hypothetical protein
VNIAGKNKNTLVFGDWEKKLRGKEIVLAFSTMGMLSAQLVPVLFLRSKQY